MTAKSGRNGRNNRLEEAMTLLIQNQATFVQNQATFNQTLASYSQSQAAQTQSLNQTLAIFTQNQAAFNQTIAQQNQNQTVILAELRELERQTAERFARIERILLEHTNILQEHSRILANLPEAVRQKIGFDTIKQ